MQKTDIILEDLMLYSSSSAEETGKLFLRIISCHFSRKSALKRCMTSDRLEDYGFAVSNVILNRLSLTESLISLRTSSLISECNSSAKKTDLIWFIFLAPVYVS